MGWASKTGRDVSREYGCMAKDAPDVPLRARPKWRLIAAVLAVAKQASPRLGTVKKTVRAVKSFVVAYSKAHAQVPRTARPQGDFCMEASH
jgi:hypothetical protein